MVEQRGVGGEALLPHQLLGVEAPVGAAVLGVALRGDVTAAAVVRHGRSPSGGSPRARRSAVVELGDRHDGGDVRVRAQHPRLARTSSQGFGERAGRVECGDRRHPDRRGDGGGRGVGGRLVGAVGEEHEEPFTGEGAQPPCAAIRVVGRRTGRARAARARRAGRCVGALTGELPRAEPAARCAHGPSGTSTPGPGGGTAPRGGRPPNGRVGSGVVSGESWYQNGSASLPESTWARAAGSCGGAGEHVGAQRRALRVGRDQEVHRRRRHRDVLHAPPRAARRDSSPAAPPAPSRSRRARSSTRRSPRRPRRS